MTTLYAIPNCNTVKKARTWLEEQGVDYKFHNYKKSGIDKATLEQWVDELGWEAVLNKKGMTWRKLDEATRLNMNAEGAIAVMLENQSIIKRPIIVNDSGKLLGFNAEAYEAFFH